MAKHVQWALSQSIWQNLLQDLYKPDSTRLRRNLSGIINFAKFREEKLVPYTDMQESVEHLLEDTAEFEELNMRLVSSVYCLDRSENVLKGMCCQT